MIAYNALNAKFDELKKEFPSLSFGYIGNLSRWGDDRSWYIFLPPDPKNLLNTGPYLTVTDRVGGYSTDNLDKMLAAWPALEMAIRKAMVKRNLV